MEIPDLSGVASSSNSVPRFVFARQDPGRTYRDDREILLEDWTEAYRSSTQWGSDAIAIFDGGSWPADCQAWQNKLFRDGRILVPEKLVRRVIWAQHARTGHFGRRRLVSELNRRFLFPSGIDLWKEVAEVRAKCRICQACEAENQSLQGPERPHPIIDQFLASVCLDIFDMPEEDFGGEKFDCFLLCVDRFTEWMIARPTRKEGLTGEKAAMLLWKES